MMPASGEQLPDLDQQLRQDLAAWVQQIAPANVLAIGRRAGELLRGDLPDGAQLEAIDSRDAFAAAKELGAFELVLVTDTVEHMDKPAAEQLLGSLRDLHAHHLFLLVPIGEVETGQQSVWAPGDLLALGMTRVGQYSCGTGQYQLYHFALETYKQVPDWLNSKYWAHPERFDIYEE
jgi:hypothetical protein